MASEVRQGYHKECEEGVNTQINLELYIMYTYLSMASYYDRHDISLPGIAKFLRKSAREGLKRSQKLMEYQNKRGGIVRLMGLKKPAKEEWGAAQNGMKMVLEMELIVNTALLDLRKISGAYGDFQMSDFLDKEFLNVQMNVIKELGSYITQLEHCGPGHGEFEFDEELSE